MASRGDNAEILLFHGTRENNPALIYSGDDGFDMRYYILCLFVVYHYLCYCFRYSKEGMWGRGAYFAQNAIYSHNYAFHANNFLQLFSARVAVGKTIRIFSTFKILI